MYAGPQIYRQGARLVAIAKERLGDEEFLSDHWNSSGGLRNQWLLNSDADKVSEQENLAAFPNPELYYDTWKDGSLTGVNPLFRVTNGTSMKYTGVLSYLVGGAVATNNSRVNEKEIIGNMDGEGTILGSVLVINKHGEVLLHHKEQSWGDHPSDEDLYQAISKLQQKDHSSL
jgi:hypothetical protein